MTMDSNASSSIVRLNIGGYEFLTTVGTLTNREPQSMLAAMFSGRHAVYKDPEKGFVFIDRDGKHFGHILNWLRDGVAPIPNLSDLERAELLREAEYYQLLGLVDKINEVLNKKKDEQLDTELTRADIIKSIQMTSSYVKLRGDLSDAQLSYACLKSTSFSGADLRGARFMGANLQSANLQGLEVLNNAYLKNIFFSGANLRGARFFHADLHSANLQGANLSECKFNCVDLRSAHLETANLTNADLEGANLEGANFKVANLRNANLKNANLLHAHLEGANLDGAKLLGAIR